MSELPGTDPSLPSDVYAGSRSRVPLIRRAGLAATMVRLFGVELLYGICVLAGEYLSTAVILHTFAQQLPPGAISSLPSAP